MLASGGRGGGVANVQERSDKSIYTNVAGRQAGISRVSLQRGK